MSARSLVTTAAERTTAAATTAPSTTSEVQAWARIPPAVCDVLVEVGDVTPTEQTTKLGLAG